MELLIYLSKASLLLFLFWAFYKLLLERESYHLFKRIYLYCGIGFSAILPLIHYTTYTTLHLPKQENFISAGTQDQPIINTSLIERILGYATEHHLFEIIYFSISTVFLCYFAFSFYKILRFLKQAKKEKKNGIYYIQTEKDTAFSFLNYIVYNPQMYSEKELIFVLKHEQAHVECKHSFDALLAMLYRSFFWFNPFAWLYKKAITQNIEFEADAKAVTQTTSKDYQYSLYRITTKNYELQHSFHQSSLKKRIMMLNTINSKNSTWKIFAITPLLFLYFMFFQTETKAQIVESSKVEADVDYESKVEITRLSSTFDEKSSLESLKRILYS